MANWEATVLLSSVGLSSQSRLPFPSSAGNRKSARVADIPRPPRSHPVRQALSHLAELTSFLRVLGCSRAAG